MALHFRDPKFYKICSLKGLTTVVSIIEGGTIAFLKNLFLNSMKGENNKLSAPIYLHILWLAQSNTATLIASTPQWNSGPNNKENQTASSQRFLSSWNLTKKLLGIYISSENIYFWFLKLLRTHLSAIRQTLNITVRLTKIIMQVSAYTLPCRFSLLLTLSLLSSPLDAL